MFENVTKEECRVVIIFLGQVSNYKYNVSDVSGSCLPAPKLHVQTKIADKSRNTKYSTHPLSYFLRL